MTKTFTAVAVAALALTLLPLSVCVAQSQKRPPDKNLPQWVIIHTKRMKARLADGRTKKAKEDAKAAVAAKTPASKLIGYCPDCNAYYSSAEATKMKMADPMKHKLYLVPKESIASDAERATMPKATKKHSKQHKM
jgi:hypothetical protein